VEDNALKQLVAERVVAKLGYCVDIVANGVEALEAIDAGAYAAVLMDCHMPVMDGFDATREVRRREADGSRMPVIAMTAGAMSEDRERCLAAGMDDYVFKPVDIGVLKAVLARWVSSAAGASGPDAGAVAAEARCRAVSAGAQTADRRVAGPAARLSACRSSPSGGIPAGPPVRVR